MSMPAAQFRLAKIEAKIQWRREYQQAATAAAACFNPPYCCGARYKRPLELCIVRNARDGTVYSVVDCYGRGGHISKGKPVIVY